MRRLFRAVAIAVAILGQGSGWPVGSGAAFAAPQDRIPKNPAANRANEQGRDLIRRSDEAARRQDFDAAISLLKQARPFFERAASLDTSDEAYPFNINLVDRTIRDLEDAKRQSRPSGAAINLDERTGQFSCMCGDSQIAGPFASPTSMGALSIRYEQLMSQAHEELRTDNFAKSAALAAEAKGVLAQMQAAEAAFKTHAAGACLTACVKPPEPPRLTPVTPPASSSNSLPAVPSDVPGDSNSNARYLSLDRFFDKSATGPVRVTVTPVFKSWVPPYLKDALKELSFSAKIVSFRGDVSIRRGDKEIRLRDISDFALLLRPGDIFITGPDGQIEFEASDGSRWSTKENSSFAVGAPNCLLGGDTIPASRADRLDLFLPHLIRGTLVWLATGQIPKPTCKNVIRVSRAGVSKRGTEFTATYEPGSGVDVLTLVVESGSVDVIDMVGETTTVNTGATGTFRYPLAPPLRADDAVARAMLSGETTADGGRAFVPAGATGVWLDGTTWQLPRQRPEESNVHTFTTVSGQVVAGVLTSEPEVFSRDELWDMPLRHALASDPNARMIRQEWRKVRELTVLYFEVQATSHMVVGEYFSGAQGTAYLRMAAKALGEEERALVAAVLNGFVAVNPLSLPDTENAAQPDARALTPDQEFAQAPPKVFSSAGHPKSRGVDLRVQYPATWRATESQAPNSVQFLLTESGLEACLLEILVMSPQDGLSQDNFEATLDREGPQALIPADATLISGGKTKIDNLVAASLRVSQNIERADIKIHQEALRYVFMWKDRFISFGCFVGDPAPGAAATEHFRRYETVFHRIAATIVIENQWRAGITAPALTPEDEFSRDRKVFSTAGHPKAQGVSLRFEYPASWNATNVSTPTDVQLLSSSTGGERCRLNISIPGKEANLSELTFQTSIESDGVEKLALPWRRFVSGRRAKIDNLFAAVVREAQTFEPGNANIGHIETVSNIFMWKDRLITLECWVADAEAGAVAAEHFQRYETLFDRIAASMAVAR